MGKPNFGLEKIMGRRKSQGNAIEEVESPTAQDASPVTESPSPGGFHIMSKEEAERRRESAASKKAPEKRTGFGRFSALGGHKGRNHSFEDESASSKRYVFRGHGKLAIANLSLSGIVSQVVARISPLLVHMKTTVLAQHRRFHRPPMPNLTTICSPTYRRVLIFPSLVLCIPFL